MSLSQPFTLLMSKRVPPMTSLLLTAPVFLVYHLGLLFINYRNGVDWVTGFTLELVEWNEAAYVGLTVAVVCALALYCYVRDRQQPIPRPLFGRVLLESLAWAIVMMVSVGWAISYLSSSLSRSLAVGPIANMGTTDKIVMAAGAGFHEEVVFRVLVLGGLWTYLKGRKMSPGASFGWACLVSALVFAGAHHLGSLSEPFTAPVFAFRALAGTFLGLIYAVRGFAIAVYTHTLYDILIFFFPLFL